MDGGRTRLRHDVCLLLMAGEIYTTFTFLGGSGWAYGKGGPAFYIIAYGCLAYILSYWLLPAVWTYAKQHKLMSQSDFYFKIQQPAPRHSRIARRHRIPHPLSRSAAERARINCFSNIIRTDSALRRCLDRRCLHHDLCDDFRNPWFSVDIRRQRYHDFRHRPVFRHLSAHSLLWRVYGDVQTN